MLKKSNLEDEFVFVRTRRKRKKSKVNCVNTEEQDQSEHIDKNTALRRIETAVDEIQSSDLFSSIFALLREGLQTLHNPEIKKIICLGIGHIGERIVPKYQLALLLCLRKKLDIPVYIQEPFLWGIEKEILNDLNFVVLDKNLEGKYKISDDFTVFYLPHCPKQLTNNLLWCNWGLNLQNCMIISNSFSAVTENLSQRQLTQSANFICDILPYTLELAVINSFKYYDVFNDTAIHVFPLDKLNLISKDFWDNRDEPVYNDDITEFVTNKINYDITMPMSENLVLLRRLLSEVRKASSTGQIRDSLLTRYLVSQFRRYNVTEEQHCRAQEEMSFLCSSYLCYLQSARMSADIAKNYQGRGERTVEQTASLVGFKLPHDPK